MLIQIKNAGVAIIISDKADFISENLNGIRQTAAECSGRRAGRNKNHFQK